jgi:hypothetical protein
LGTQIETSAEQRENEYPGIRESLHPGSKISDVRLVILQRAADKIIVNDAGRESDFNMAHPKSAWMPIVSSSEGESKKIEDSAEQPQRHFDPITRTVFGIERDSSEEQFENVNSGISTSRDPVSNVNDESNLQPEKQPSPKISTDEGIQIDLREKHEENALCPIRITCDTGVNVIAESNLQSWKHASSRDPIDEET